MAEQRQVDKIKELELKIDKLQNEIYQDRDEQQKYLSETLIQLNKQNSENTLFHLDTQLTVLGIIITLVIVVPTILGHRMFEAFVKSAVVEASRKFMGPIKKDYKNLQQEFKSDFENLKKEFTHELTVQKTKVRTLEIKNDLHFKGMEAYNKKEFDKSYEFFKGLVNKHPSDDAANYNFACACALLNKKEESLEYLKKSINLDPYNKARAASDADFNRIKNSIEFKNLVGLA